LHFSLNFRHFRLTKSEAAKQLVLWLYRSFVSSETGASALY
jgi:hypothetical protein